MAQLSQVFGALLRSGNVHDSNGSLDFITDCVQAVDEKLPGLVIESRFDSAFCSEDTALLMEELETEYTISVPFERLPELKGMIEQRQRWTRIDDTWSCFEAQWKPKKWLHPVRFVFVRPRSAKRRSGRIQLDLFEPVSTEYSYKVIMTNKRVSAKSVMLFHHGRGSQEGIIGEAKASAKMDDVPTRSWAGNQFYMLASFVAHKVTRELQMRTQPRHRGTNPKRAVLWVFEKLETVRNRTIRRAGRLNRPDGVLTLTLSGNEAVQGDYERIRRGLEKAA